MYFSLPLTLEMEESNVISFDKNLNREKKQVLTLLKTNNSKEFERISFRVFDLSLSGCTFLCNEDEKHFLESLKEFTGATIEEEGNDGLHVSAKLAYAVDYLDQNFSNIKMNKIGVTFMSEIDRDSFLEIFNFQEDGMHFEKVGLDYELFLSHLD